MRHGHRTSVAPEDVQLAARKNERTKAIIDSEAVRLRGVRKDAADVRAGKRAKTDAQ